MPRILAVDWGARRIGLAISDPDGIIATGLETLQVKTIALAVQAVADTAAAQGAASIVVGLPLLMSGERGEAAHAAESFARDLSAVTPIPVDTYDERLTSALSERRLREVGVRTGKARARVDQGAAVALLESFLHYRRSRAR